MNPHQWATQYAETQPLPRSRTEFALALEGAYLAGQIQAINEETKQISGPVYSGPERRKKEMER